MHATPLDAIQAELEARGPLAAADALCEQLKTNGDWHSYFYARLLRKRVELGVSPFPSGPSSDLPAATHEPYEAAIRDSAREVGHALLAQNDFPRAWGYFRLIGEPGPVRDALDRYEPGPDDDTYPVVDIAWHQQVNPKRGFDIYLSRHGICSTITMVGSTDLSAHPEIRNHCYGRLVRTLHDQLAERLRNDLEHRGLPIADSVRGMIRDELFGDDAYHIDVSHLSSVVQMAMQLPPTERESLALALELCEYGQRLAPQFQGGADCPFENTYGDYAVYLKTLLGIDPEAGLKHFEGKIAGELAEGNTQPAEIYVNLLLKLDRKAEALAAARKYLEHADERNLSCPGPLELARQAGDYEAVAATAKATGDAVTYLAGLIAGKK
jgi:hypothetical protein